MMLSKALAGKISLRLLPFLFILYIISYLDRINLSFAALEMNNDLKFSAQDFGFGSGIFFLGYCLFGIPSNYVIEKIGPRRWIAGIMVLWGFITIGMCLVKDPMSFFIMRFVLGAAEAGFFPGMLLYLTYWFPKDLYGTAVARFMTAIPAAGLLGSVVAARALSMGGHMDIAGWKWLFIITGIPAIVLGALVPFLIPDNPLKANWLSETEKSEIKEALAQEAGGATSDSAKEKSPFIDVARFALIYFTLTVSMYGYQFWLPQIVRATTKADDSVVSLLTAIPAIFQAGGMLLIAASSDKKGERRLHLVLATVITIAGLCLASLGGQPQIAAYAGVLTLSALSLAAFGIWGAVGPFWALTRGGLKKESQAAGIAFINSVGNLGGFAGPFLIGYIKQNTEGFGPSLLSLAAAAVFASLLAFTSKEKGK